MKTLIAISLLLFISCHLMAEPNDGTEDLTAEDLIGSWQNTGNPSSPFPMLFPYGVGS